MKIAVLTLLSTISVVLAEQKLGFVFEIVRHGARAPLLEEPDGFFKVKAGMLTAQGMRQRYLLGRLNRDRYIDQYGLIDKDYNPKQILITSTNYLRTIQSSYSEMMGLYPPHSFTKSKLSEGENQSLKSGKGLPKLARSSKQEDIERLGSLVDGYTFIPVYNYYELPLEDDVSQKTCPFTRDCFNYYYKTPSEFTQEGKYVLPFMRESVGKAFNLSADDIKNMDYLKYYYYGDIIHAESFEGDPNRYKFSVEEWYYMRQSQRIVLSKGLNDQAKKLYGTKFFRKPLKAMADRFNDLINGNDNPDQLRYMIYSGHDDQIVNIIDWLNPQGHEYIDATYTSTIYFELFYDTDCLKANPKSHSCFEMHMRHNGVPIKFDTCVNNNMQAQSGSILCKYDDFLTYMNSKMITDDVNVRCMDKFTPPTTQKKKEKGFWHLFDKNK
ncbi:major acid phosphatase map (histidine-acid phosphatase) [Stylonychia lemnae]|uniref:Major acid phosphatase map (Histidine-acid phosphatase) n=1 Tax=Stylonychia lemnae TaxID=5949 RepID=A0A077ZPA2_STYLE|nr:major acid phosphatase map (histidine-acid phosphatase) [Stylonychia lemnae]|eukprot:CDW71215.1 major acid phosphatase map (histidine-acid phosphatase) [Stylonychia lemnae]